MTSKILSTGSKQQKQRRNMHRLISHDGLDWTDLFNSMILGHSLVSHLNKCIP